MKRCTHPGCGGTLFSEPADDFQVGPTRVKRTQFVCNFCARVTKNSPPEPPLPLVHVGRFKATKTIRTGTGR